MRLPVVLLASALLLAGCTGLPGGGDEEAAPAEEIEPAQESPPVPTPATPTPSPAPSSSSPSPPSPPPAQEPPAMAPPPPEPPAPPRIVVYGWNGTVTGAGAAADVPVASRCCVGAEVAAENTRGSFELPAGLRGVVVELAWSDPQFDLDLHVFAPDYAEQVPPAQNGTGVETASGHSWRAMSGSVGAPDGYARLLIAQPDALALVGTWDWVVDGKTSNAVAFEVAVSLHYDVAPGDAHRQLGARSDNP